jgi:hypothetical protein
LLKVALDHAQELCDNETIMLAVPSLAYSTSVVLKRFEPLVECYAIGRNSPALTAVLANAINHDVA